MVELEAQRGQAIRLNHSANEVTESDQTWQVAASALSLRNHQKGESLHPQDFRLPRQFVSFRPVLFLPHVRGSLAGSLHDHTSDVLLIPFLSSFL